MSNVQRGFTLIELIMVILILGILAATAVPKFVDLSADARQASTDGLAGNLGAASAINFAVCSARGSSDPDCTSVADCTDTSSLLEGGLPAGYTITSAAITSGSTASCTLTNDDGGETSTFTGHGV